MDRSRAEVVATLLDEEVCLCCERTIYRVLASEVPVQERRAQRTHPGYMKPELTATALEPGVVLGYHAAARAEAVRRYVLPLRHRGHLWPLRRGLDGGGPGEPGSSTAGSGIRHISLKHGVQPRRLTLRSNRGAPMTSQCTARLLADLGEEPLVEPASGVK